ncbi:MFS transporter [Rhizobium sp. BR 314]|uniref:MFS transporter n=1 Tax=Rhizobium sp. BR 314 TaxID=3040013 RepID=UPI0039BFB240
MSNIRHGNPRFALAAICLSAMMFGLEISSVPAILPTLERTLHADFQQLQWTMNAYTLAVATVLMAAGTLADRYGRKRLFVGSMIAFGLSSLVCGIAPNIAILITGRALQGATGGAMLISQIAVLSQQYGDARERAKAFGWWGIVFGFGLGFGPAIGSGITALMGWEWVFLVHVLISILTVFLAVVSVRETRDPNAQHLDIAGIVSLSAAVFCLVFYITQGSQLGFINPVSLGAAAIAVVSFIVFMATELSKGHPMFDFTVFRIRRFSGAIFGSMGMNFSFWPFMIYIPIWFEAGLGLDGVATGIALLAYTLPTLIVPPFAERLLLRRGPGIVIPAGLFTIGLGFLLMKFGPAAGEAILPVTLLGALIAGVGLGVTNTPVTNTTTGSVSSDRAGMASGIDMSARMISLAVNIAVMGFILMSGILANLQAILPISADPTALPRLAERIASGNVSAVNESMAKLSGDIARKALTAGFDWVMLYGALSVWGLAFLSLIAFGTSARGSATAPE